MEFGSYMDSFDLFLKSNPFKPFPGIKHGIIQTIWGSQFSGEILLPNRKVHKVKLNKYNQLMLFELPAKNSVQPGVLLAHGMGGCSESAYIRRISQKLFNKGFHVFQMNQRGSGPGIGLCNRLWNGGSSDDFASTIKFLARLYPNKPFFLIGFSLSGNILLKYLGEKRSVPPNIYSGLAVNPPVDLEAASLAISKGPFANIFNSYYLKLMHRQADAMVQCFPETYYPSGKAKTIYEFDIEYTAPAAGYKTVLDYYQTCSANQFLNNISIPTTILCSIDDPFVPPQSFEKMPRSLNINLIQPEFGGHMGYISRSKTPWKDRRWLDHFCVEWVENSFRELKTSQEYSAIAV